MPTNRNEQERAEPQGSLPLLIPENIRYTCQGCGRCCSGQPAGLSAEEYARLSEHDWVSVNAKLLETTLFTDRSKEFKDGQAQYPYFTAAKADGSCSLLLDSRCLIHSHLGEQAKPRSCQLFPYTFVATPSGIYVGLLFTSMAALNNAGERLSDQRESLERLWSEEIDRQKALGKLSQEVAAVASKPKLEDLSSIAFPVNLAPGMALTWSEYLLIEAKMMELINGSKMSDVFHTLIAMTEILNESVRLKTNQSDLQALDHFIPDSERWLKSKPGFFEEKVFSLLCFKDLLWPEIVAQQGGAQALAKNALTDPKILSQAVSTVFFDRMSLPGLGPVKVDQAKKLKIASFSQEINEFVQRWLYLKIFSKTYFGASLSGLSLISGCNNLIGGFLCALLFAKAHALSRQSDHITVGDLQEGIFLHERESNALGHLEKDKADFFDSGFSSPRLFTRLVGQMSKTVAN